MKKIVIYLSLLYFTNLYANQLENETSPYLLQHANNPVNWYPWGKKAFDMAKKEHKPIFLSIGYSTCHWCHVMEEESFTNNRVAKLLNKYFISIEVDREEFPQIDNYYQQMYLKVKGRWAGWPISIFMSEDKKPFYFGAYIPAKKRYYHEGFDTLLPRLAKMYRQKGTLYYKKIAKIESLITKDISSNKNKDKNVSIKTLVSSINKEYDDFYGGFGDGKKFPEASKISLMMDLANLDKNKTLKKRAYDTLNAMAKGGLYDEIDGGFFRYTTDASWNTPHFEKMLYNQAELIPLYVRAYLATHKKFYKSIVTQTINMVIKRFSKNNLFYSASDADSDGREGGYFTFSIAEIQKALKNIPNAKKIKKSINFNKYGNYHREMYIIESFKVKGFTKFIDNLKKIRKTKTYPFIDKKINTAWNAMMIEALYKASYIDDKYRIIANKHLKSLENFMFRRGELYHQSLIGIKPRQKGLLEDYSFLISALISGYEVDYDSEKIEFGEYLLNNAKSQFYKNSIWYLSNDNLDVKADLKDKYYTSALGKMLQDIVKMASLKESFRYDKLANNSLKSIYSMIQKKQSNVPASATAFLMQNFHIITIKSSKKVLLKNRFSIKNISYPYILTKIDNYGGFLACTIRSCFAKENSLNSLKDVIKIYTKKRR